VNWFQRNAIRALEELQIRAGLQAEAISGRLGEDDSTGAVNFQRHTIPSWHMPF
jgi:hypothetical protein